MRETIYKMITDFVDNSIDSCISDEVSSKEWDYTALNEIILPVIPLAHPITQMDDCRKKDQLKQVVKEQAVKLYEDKEAEFPEPEHIRELERIVLLKVIDRKWMDHMDQLRQGIGLQAYGQKDPVVEYKMSGFDMFNSMISNIQEDTVKLLMHIRVEQKVEREQVAKVTGTNKDDSAPRGPVKRTEKKVYPNELCPCGSGKKYKQCCGRKTV
jgi:preprotein translocase subunit SecA